MDARDTIRTRTINGLIVAEPFVDLLQRHQLDSLEALLQYQSKNALDKPGLPLWRQRIRMELANVDGQSIAIYMKRYQSPPASEQRARILSTDSRHGTAWREWQTMHELAGHGIAVPTPVAYGQSMRGRRELASLVLAEEVPGESLERWADHRSDRAPREMMLALADFVRRFHELGYVHRDLYLCHVFFDRSAKGRPFHLIDLQRVMKPRFRPERWRVKDLAALNYSTPAQIATATDRARFLKQYLDGPIRGSETARLTRRVMAKTRSIAAHDTRRNARFNPIGEEPA